MRLFIYLVEFTAWIIICLILQSCSDAEYFLHQTYQELFEWEEGCEPTEWQGYFGVCGVSTDEEIEVLERASIVIDNLYTNGYDWFDWPVDARIVWIRDLDWPIPEFCITLWDWDGMDKACFAPLEMMIFSGSTRRL